MSWPEPHLSYLPYLSFVEYVIALISQIVAITLLSYLALCFLFNRKRMTVDTLSKSMLVYLFYHIIFSPFGILYHGYMVIKWRPEFNNYDTNVVFWLGIFGVNYYAISPIPVLFLTLDRCLVLSRISACYNENIRKTLFLTSILVIVFCFVGSTVIFLLELPLDQDKVCHCVNFSCLILKYKTRPQQLPRLAVESLNLLFSLYFFRALKKPRCKNLSDNGNLSQHCAKLHKLSAQFDYWYIFGELPRPICRYVFNGGRCLLLCNVYKNIPKEKTKAIKKRFVSQ
ncbi:hypothetical protein Ddc_01294 [Ditylenchus destructor]|nr:hypothetical protein Ddc_01294 [Ditylenchus destructor]